MKKMIFILAVMFCFAGCGFAQVEKNLLIEDFEGAITGGPDGTVDFGSGNGSSLSVTAASDIKQSGAQSLKAEYNAVSGGYMYIAKGSRLDAKNAGWQTKPDEIKWQDYNTISFYMYGSDSKTRVAFDLKDNGNELWRFILEDNFKGWKEIVAPFSGFFPRDDWQPDNADKNGNLDFPVKSFQFEPLPAAKGTLYFDQVSLSKR
jgi:hypothetical protein